MTLYSIQIGQIMKKTVIVFLLILNMVVLLGQLWPEGAPPFANKVNVVFLVASFLFFLFTLVNTGNRK